MLFLLSYFAFIHVFRLCSALHSQKQKNPLLQISDLKGILHPILCHLFLGFLGRCYFLWQVAQHEERLFCSNAHKLPSVRPEDLKTERQDIIR